MAIRAEGGFPVTDWCLRHGKPRCECDCPPDFFTEAHARRSDPETSKDAAERVGLSDLEQKALNTLAQLGGEATTKEKAAYYGLPRDYFSPRMKPLEEAGFVERTTLRRDGCLVWRITPLGMTMVTVS